jgi:hypothetical protein
MSEYMIRTGFDRAFQISFNIIRMLKGCKDVVDTIRGCAGHRKWAWAPTSLGFGVYGLGGESEEGDNTDNTDKTDRH